MFKIDDTDFGIDLAK
jgi:hypothetical protein